MKVVFICISAWILTGCSDSDQSQATTDAAVPCVALFGQPTGSTGLEPEACAPTCECGRQPFAPRPYDETDIEALNRFQLIDAPTPLDVDPYTEPEPEAVAPGTVCAVLIDESNSNTYALNTYVTAEAAALAGAQVTHAGACGLCSSLQNLAVYMGNPDLTDPVRQCGLAGIGGGREENVACLQAIGFDLPCAQIWYYNTNHTRTQCFDLCIAHLNSPHHTEEGALNPCIQCDEDQSGPIFKAVAGRTRRNSGLPSALCRPCESVYPIEHNYP